LDLTGNKRDKDRKPLRKRHQRKETNGLNKTCERRKREHHETNLINSRKKTEDVFGQEISCFIEDLERKLISCVCHFDEKLNGNNVRERERERERERNNVFLKHMTEGDMTYMLQVLLLILQSAIC
jgi:hypothetical protein